MIKKYIQEHKNDIINDLCEIVRIPSVSGTLYCADALKRIKTLYEKNGFCSELYEDYLLSYYKNGEHTIGLFAHADVVEASGPWKMCQNPFEPTVSDGLIFGRGVLDNKIAVILSLYAMKIIKELKIPFDSSILCFSGSNEETTMQDVKNYAKSHTLPDFSLVMDAAFPVYLGDKGMLWLECTQDRELCDLVDIFGGTAVNITLGKANARIKYTKSLYDELKERKELFVARENDEIVIEAIGVSNHGAMPYNTVNAGGMILSALFESSSFAACDKKSLKLLHSLLTSYDGAPLGINAYDEVFRDTTVTNGMLRVENGKLKFTLDIRYGKTYSTARMLEKIGSVLSENGISYEIKKYGEPSAISRDNKYVQACMQAYKEFTSEENAEPRINAGGTYSRYLPSSCEIGTTLIWQSVNLPSGHGGAHQADEYISIDGFLSALELIVKMLIECDKKK